MLDFKSNRLTYAELLVPPDGYELIQAVGTTYSMDLFALLAIPVAMFYNRSLDGNYMQNRYDILDAIRKSKERVTVFCQRGKIHKPDSYSNLLAFVEDCIVEILPSDEFASFHPKIWVLRFEKKKQVYYRLAVLSRNLTFDRSWDISCFAEGKPGTKPTEGGLKLEKFMRYLYMSGDKVPDKKFLRDLSRISFDLPEVFENSAIFPMVGSGAVNGLSYPLADRRYQELIVVSPFVDDQTLLHLKDVHGQVTLFSRGDELDKLNETSLEGITAYAFNHSIRDGEHSLDNEDQTSLHQDLHAKIFIGKNKGVTDWLIGSANCTNAAITRNTEFLIEFSGKNHAADLTTINTMLTDPQHRVFLPYKRLYSAVDETNGSIERLIRRINYKLCAAVFEGLIRERTDQQNFDLEIGADLREIASHQDIQLFASLLHQQNDKALELLAGEENTVIFQNIALTKLSNFLAIEIQVDEVSVCRLVIKIKIGNMPGERDDVIFNELISSKKSFYRYLQFLLSPDEFDGLADIIDDSDIGTTGKDQASNALENSPPIYEHLLLAASRSPSKLREINHIMHRLERLNSEIIEEFKPIWEVFKKFADE
jgi:hypothetical protein